MLGRLWRLLGFSNTDQEPHQRQAQYHPLPFMAPGYPPPFGPPSGMALASAGNSNHAPVAPGLGLFHQGQQVPMLPWPPYPHQLSDFPPPNYPPFMYYPYSSVPPTGHLLPPHYPFFGYPPMMANSRLSPDSQKPLPALPDSRMPGSSNTPQQAALVQNINIVPTPKHRDLTVSHLPAVAPKSEPSSDWPTGYERRECIVGQETRKWKYTKWVWRSSGNVQHEGRRAEKRICMGVFKCMQCGLLSRPKTEPGARKLQSTTPCHGRTCPSKDPPVHVTCDARTFHFVIEHDGIARLVWEHYGDHASHERPPGGHLSKDQEDQVDGQVMRHHDASAHQLRTGDTGPGSVPLPEISATLANPRAARYQLTQSQARLSIANSPVKGGLAVFHSFGLLQKQLKAPFVIDSSVHGPIYILMSTPFMDKLIKDAVNAWLEDSRTGTNDDAEGRHGFVMDGDHTFFREGLLLVTCVFSLVLNAWAPVLYAWIDGQDMAHHRPHFRHVFQSVIKHAGSRFDRKFLFHVMDFSAAQRSAHAEEYADAVTALQPSFRDLLAESQVRERKRYVDEAAEAVLGCGVHFWRSATRIKKNGALVPPLQSERFNNLLYRLISSNTSSDEFDDAVATLRSDFPRIKGWLDWWLRPKFASMIFPARSVVDPSHAQSVPSTSNPAEHQHSLLHHATGIDQDLIPGIRKLFLHVQEIQAQYEAIQGGHFSPAKARNSRPPVKSHWDENDGRAPDTADWLDRLDPHVSQVPVLSSGLTEADSALRDRLLQSYQWLAPNSCFFDHTMELWFRAYCSWPSAQQKKFLASVPTQSALAGIFYHFDRRLKWINHPSSTTINGLRELGLGQGTLRHLIFHKWKLYNHSSDYGCAITWTHHAVLDSHPSFLAQGGFGIHHSLVSVCPVGHETAVSTGSPTIIFGMGNTFDTFWTESLHGSTMTISDFLSNMFPRRSIGTEHGGTTLVHKLPGHTCSHSDCLNMDARVSPTTIKTFWPQLLQITLNSRSDTDDSFEKKVYPKITRLLTIKDPTGTGIPVKYQIVGRIFHQPDHWTCDVILGNRLFAYNDMKHSGKLVEIGPDTLIETPDVRTSFVIYNRISVADTITHTIVDTISAYAKAEAAYNKRDISPPISVPSRSHQSDDIQNTLSRDMTPPPFSTHLLAPFPMDKPEKPLPPFPNVEPLLDLTLRSTSPWEISCGHCGKIGEGSNTDGNTIQCDACLLWSHMQCMDLIFAIPQDFENGSFWLCPTCDKKLLGQFVMSKSTDAGRYFPAQIISHIMGSTTDVMLRWYSGNLYLENERPTTLEFTATKQECLDAQEFGIFKYTKASWTMKLHYPCVDLTVILQDTVGPIKWPLQLVEEACDNHGYTNQAVSEALEDSYSSILDILLGNRAHPLMGEFLTWMGQLAEGNRIKHAFDFGEEQFNLHIHLGDQSLIEPLIARLLGAHRNLGREFENSMVIQPALLLFKLVIARTYLQRLPSDDLQIYYLARNFTHKELDTVRGHDQYAPAKHGHLVLNFTIHERALAAGQGSQDRRHHLGSNVFCPIQRVPDPEEHISDNFKHADAKTSDDQPYKWLASNDVGLTTHAVSANNRDQFIAPHSRKRKAITQGEAEQGGHENAAGTTAVAKRKRQSKKGQVAPKRAPSTRQKRQTVR